ncbi:MAG TPA: SpoIIE family protein phosphatase [Acidobacteriaceae bacterium]|nr:SpoIIE family protein phosphatase [Acidobacteriaceae bacterium]
MVPKQSYNQSVLRRLEEQFFHLLHRKPPASRLGNSVFWLFALTVGLYVLAWLPGGVGEVFRSLGSLTLLAGVFGAIPLVVRWLRWRMLWKLRNRLLVTYLLIGLAPVVLFGTLAAIAAYVCSGQFANFAATAEINTQLAELATRNQAFDNQIAHAVTDHGGSVSTQQAMGIQLSNEDMALAGTGLKLGAFLDGVQLAMPSLPEPMQMQGIAPPHWAGASFRGLVLDHDQVFFRAIDRERAGTHSIVTITSLPLNSEFLGRVASGLGRITMLPNTRVTTRVSNRLSPSAGNLKEPAKEDSDAAVLNQAKTFDKAGKTPVETISGGTLAKRVNLLDIPINIPTLLETTDWQSGLKFAVVAVVTSRPSLLYQRLFQQSVLMGTALRIALIVAAIVFGVLQLLALLMASRLSRTITKSVADLYEATHAVDEGNLNYRIQVTRNDQLAELSSSFNRMATSLERSLLEQKEKERMLSELAIAQEVQENLFPNRDVSFSRLELYGGSRPARAVSGDYYDFLLFGETSVGLAIGDISGKGISAALLMATLHSAVRAYRFYSEDMIANHRLLSNGSPTGGNGVDREMLEDIFQSPGKVLSLLNRHLYFSTQPEKYATLFLARYDAKENMLRYSNGGQLPPLVLRADDSVERLDCGGTVVGLIEGVTYEDGGLQLAPGDIFVGYSDGVTEPENEFGDFGEERMIELIRQNRHLPLSEICSRMMLALDDWIGAAEQPDDITLVLARQR